MPAKTKRKAKPSSKRKYRGLTRLDPTRTVTLRRAFAATLRKQFARLKAAVVLLVAKEDAFGLRADREAAEQVLNWCNQYGGDTCHVGGGKIPTRAESNAKVGKVMTDGLKASQMPKEQRAAYAKNVSSVLNRMPDEALSRIAENLQSVNFYGDLKELGLSANIEDDRTRDRIASGEVQVGGYYRKSDRLLALDGDSRNSPASALYAHELTHAIDGPGYEISSSPEWGAAFAAELKGGQLTRYGGSKPSEGLAEFGRFLYAGDRQEEVRARFPRCWAVFEQLGLLPRAAPTRQTRNAVPTPFPDVFDFPAPMTEGGDADVLLKEMTMNTRWRFSTSPEKLKEFQKWLREQFGSQVAGKNQKDLWQKFIEEGFRKGSGRSFDDVRQSRLRSERPELFTSARQGSVGDFYQGSRDEFLRSSFARPETIEKVQLLAERVYSDLDGITEEMGARMSRTLAEGLTRGQHPNEIARALADEVDIGRGRAETIARTEIIRAHAEGQLDSFKTLGVEEVGVAVEWATANDDKVCPKCQSLEGVVLKIDEARGLLPRHPGCRCAWIPANVGEVSDAQTRTQAGVEEALEESGIDDVSVDSDRPESILNSEQMSLAAEFQKQAMAVAERQW